MQPESLDRDRVTLASGQHLDLPIGAGLPDGHAMPGHNT